MGKTIRITTGNAAVAAGSTFYNSFAGTINSNATETNVSIACRPAGTFTKLLSHVSVNTLSTTATVTLRKNAADCNNAISITTTQTGIFEDTSSSDSFANGDLVALRTVSPAGSGSITYRNHSAIFDSGTNYRTQYSENGGQSIATASTTRYMTLNSLRDAASLGISAETQAQTLFQSPCTLKNLSCFVNANARTTTSTIRTRKNVGNGAQSLSITSTATGTFEDTTNSDSIVAGDNVNYQIITSTGTQTLTLGRCSVTIESLAHVTYLISCLAAATNISFGTTTYFGLADLAADATEANTALKTRLAGKLHNLTLNVSANTLNAGTTTFRLRKSTANTSISVSVGFGATGKFSDITNVETVADTDTIDYQIVTSGVSGAIILRSANADFLETSVVSVAELKTKTVNVLSNSGTGSQDIIFTPNSGDPSWTPKVAIVQWNRAINATSTWFEHTSYGYGFTDGTNQRCVSFATEDNQTDSDTARIQRNNALVCPLTPTGTIETVDAVATFTSWVTNGMRINWTDAPAAQFYLTITFLGGDDLTNATVGTLMTGTGTGNVSDTSLAYQPDFGFFLTGASTTENTPVTTGFLSLGAATSSSAQWVQSIYSADASATMSTRQTYYHDNVVVENATSTTGLASLSSFNSNGLTINISDAFTASYPVYYLVMKGGGYAVGNNTEPGSTGNQTVTTGKDTKAVFIFGLDTGTSGSPQSGCMWSSGFCDNLINQFGHVFEDTDGSASSIISCALDGVGHIYNNITAAATVGSTVWDDSALVGSVSSSGFVINWDNVGNARPYRYVTFGIAVSLTPITKDLTLKLSINQETTKQVTLKTSVLQAITKTLTTRFDILEQLTAITKTLTLKLNINQEITKTNTLKFSILQAITKQLTVKLNILNEVTKTLTTKLSILQAITKQLTLKTNIFQEITKQLTTKFTILESLTAITKQLTIKFSTHQEITKQLTTKFSIVTPITKQLTVKLNILQEITKQLTTKFSARQELTKQLTTKLSILQELTKQLTTRLDIIGRITETQTHKYNITGKVTTTKTHKYNVVRGITATKNHLYNVIGKVIRLWTHKYNVLQAVTETNTHKYNITGKVTRLRTHKYNIIGQIEANKTHKYDVTAAEGTVSRNRTHKYNIGGRVSTTKTHLYNVLDSITLSTTHKYHVLDQALTTKTHKYNVIGRLYTTKTHKYNVIRRVTATKNHLYDVLQGISEVSRNTTHVYNVLVRITKTLIHKYNVIGKVTRLRTHKHNIIATIRRNGTYKFNIIQKTTQIKAHKYNLLNRVTPDRTRTHKYNVLGKITRLRTHKYNITGRIYRTRTHKYHMGGKLVITRTHKFSVGSALGLQELGGSTHAFIRFPERVKIIDIVSNIENVVVANIEIIVSRPPANKAIAVVVIAEYSPRLLTAGSKRLNHRTISLQVLPPVIETIGQKAIAPHIAVEILPLLDKPQFRVQCTLKVAHKETIHLQSQTQVKQDIKTKIRVASAIMLGQTQQTVIGSDSNVEVPATPRPIVAPEIMTKHKAKTLKTLINLLSSDHLFEG